VQLKKVFSAIWSDTAFAPIPILSMGIPRHQTCIASWTVLNAEKMDAERCPPTLPDKRAKPVPIRLQGGTPELRNKVNHGSRSTI